MYFPPRWWEILLWNTRNEAVQWLQQEPAWLRQGELMFDPWIRWPYDNVLPFQCHRWCPWISGDQRPFYLYICLSHAQLVSVVRPYVSFVRSACSRPGVFNLSDSAGHINNCNDVHGPQTYDVHVHIIGKSGWSVNLTTNLYIMCRPWAGLAFVVIFSKQPAGHGKGLRGPHVARGPRVEDPCSRPCWFQTNGQDCIPGLPWSQDTG
jgi:hypothetical protein